LLSATDISKTFLGAKALDGVSFAVGAAEVHALVGHNGSGKSTLIKILSGYHVPDPGSGPLEVTGETVPYGDPAASHAAGLRFIHQELGLLDDLSVLENLRLGASYATAVGWRIRWGAERARARGILEAVGLDLDPEIAVSRLSPIERTQVAVARALQDADAVRVIVLDEPTATLPNAEVERLFELIARMTAQGVGIVYVSHRLEEIHQIADRVTVLREGRGAGSGPIGDFSRDRLIDLIVGAAGRTRRTPAAAVAASAESGRELLRFEAVDAGELRGATFGIATGEIVGIAGLAGSGVHDIPAALLGSIELEGGAVNVSGTAVTSPTPDVMRRLGVAVLPSARHLKGIPLMTIRENLTLSDLRGLTRRGRLDLRGERREARELVNRFHVLPPEPEKPMAELSGGNQQKVAVAKWLRVEPGLLVLDEPTQGVDVGAKAEILELLREAAASGVAVVICSSDLEDLAAVCTRVLVIRGGAVAAVLTGSAINREAITEECYRSAVAP
jgi:ribose transport system ATP-binding protein